MVNYNVLLAFFLFLEIIKNCFPRIFHVKGKAKYNLRKNNGGDAFSPLYKVEILQYIPQAKNHAFLEVPITTFRLFQYDDPKNPNIAQEDSFMIPLKIN
jgi:hypothetical protein